MAQLSRDPRWRIALALALPFVALGVQSALWPWIQPAVYFFFFPAVFFAARLGGRRAAVPASIISSVLVAYFFLPPRFSWNLNVQTIATTVLFIAMGYLFGEVYDRLNAALATAETARELTEAKYQAIVEQSLVGIYIVQDGLFRFANPRMAEILGYDSPAELIDIVRMADVVAPEERDGFMARLDEAVEGTITEADAQLRCIRKDGRAITIELHGRTLEYEGRPAIIGATLDVTDKVESLRLLREREELLARTSQLARVGGWEVDARTMEGEWSDEVARIHGLPPGTKPSVELGLSFYTPATRGLIEAAFAEALECGTPYDLELEIITAQGDSRWVRTTGEPVYEDGTIVKLVGTFQDITERREVQVALTASEEKYRLLFETLQEGVAYCEMVYDADGAPIDWRYIEVNRAYGQLTGFERIESKLASDAIPGIREANPEELGILDKVARERTPAQFDEHLPLLPNPRWLRVSATSPSEGRFVVTLADITDRKAAEEALAASELRYRTLFESLVEGVAYCEMIFDDDATPIDWVYLDVNASFPRITGLADVKGKRVVEAIPGIRESNPELFDIYGRVAQTGVPATFESYVPMLRGGVWFEVSVTRPSENRFVAAFADITERKNAAVALQESERRYRELVEQTPDGIFLADSDGHYIDVNPAGAELLGYSSDEIRHVLFTDVLDASEFHRLPGAIEHMAGGETLRSEWLFKRKDGSTFIGELVGRMLPDGKLQGILRDVTVRKNAEEAIRNLNVTLENRVEQRTAEVTAANTELEAFAYAVSHDLRAPLRAMSGFSQALVEDCADGLDAQGRDYLQHIIAASRSMGDLIDALLLLSRATRGEMHREPVNVSGLASALLDERRTVNPERVVESEVQPGLMVFGDPRMIDSLMRNLIGNAWKYSRNEPVAHITVASTDIDGQSWICVTDDGAGFDPAYSDQLFKPFRRLHRQDEFNGIGIGLATVQRIVARHGGEIRADGEVGKGASFCFRLSAPTQPSQDDPEMPGHA